MAMFARRRWPYAVAAVLAAVLVGIVAMMVLGNPTKNDFRAGSPSESQPPPADPLDSSAYDVVLTPPVEETTPPPEPVAIDLVLAAPDAELKTYADQPVRATSVNVLRRISASAAWVGDSPANRVLVLLVATENPFTFGTGAKLSFDGTVTKSSPEFGQQLGLTGEELEDFKRQGTYVEITGYQQA